MAVGSGGSRFVSRAGRAVCIRRGDALTAMPNVLREAGQAGATILIAGPGYRSSPEPEMLARHGFQVVVSAAFSDIVRNNLINAGILPVCLAPEIITKAQDTVESDPGIVLTVDASRGEMRARGKLIARFEVGQEPEPRPAEITGTSDSRGYGGETMALRLLIAQRLLGSASLPGDVRIRLQRRLVAICDAMKARGTDEVRSARRLDRFLTELARTGQDGPAQASGGRSPTPDGAAQAREPGPRDGTS